MYHFLLISLPFFSFHMVSAPTHTTKQKSYYLAIMTLVFSLLSDLPHFNQCLIFTLSISLYCSKTFHGMRLPVVHISLLCRTNLLTVACLGDPFFFFLFFSSLSTSDWYEATTQDNCVCCVDLNFSLAKLSQVRNCRMAGDIKYRVF